MEGIGKMLLIFVLKSFIYGCLVIVMIYLGGNYINKHVVGSNVNLAIGLIAAGCGIAISVLSITISLIYRRLFLRVIPCFNK